MSGIDLDTYGSALAKNSFVNKLHIQDTNNESRYVTFSTPNDIAASVDYTLPSADGSNTQVLQTNG